jgi:hypothetical protein
VRRITGKKNKPDDITVDIPEAPPDSELGDNDADPYRAILIEHADRLIEILTSIRDTSPDARNRLSAANALVELDCGSGVAEAPTVIEDSPRLAAQKEALAGMMNQGGPTIFGRTLDDLEVEIAELSARVVGEMGQDALNQILQMSEHNV